MKHILYIYHTSTIGGGSYCLLNILKELDRTRFKASVLLSCDGPLVKEINRLGIDVYLFPYLYPVPYNSSILRPKRLLNLIVLQIKYKKYVSLVKQIKPDIIYVNSMMLYPFLFIKKYYECKTIIHIREHWPKGEHIKQRLFAEKCINKFADRIVAINQYSATIFDCLKDKSIVVYDWVDLSARNEDVDMRKIFGEEASNLIIFIYTGGYVPIKGMLDILSVFKRINRNDIRLLILGEPPYETYNGIRMLKRIMMDLKCQKSYIEEVKELINSDPRIKCVPNTYNIKQYLEKSSCMLSFFKIPHANLAMAESLISGTPVIACDTSEAREYAAGGKAAMLFEFDSSSDFESNVLKYLNNPEDAKKHAVEYSKSIQSLFDSKRNSTVLNELYENI